MALHTISIDMKVDVTAEGRQALVELAREQAIALRNAAMFISAGRYKLQVELRVTDNYFQETAVTLEDMAQPVETDEAGAP